MTAVLTVLCALLLAAVPAAYYLGRRSASESLVDARLDRELYHPVNPQKAEDRAEREPGGES